MFIKLCAEWFLYDIKIMYIVGIKHVFLFNMLLKKKSRKIIFSLKTGFF